MYLLYLQYRRTNNRQRLAKPVEQETKPAAALVDRQTLEYALYIVTVLYVFFVQKGNAHVRQTTTLVIKKICMSEKLGAIFDIGELYCIVL